MSSWGAIIEEGGAPGFPHLTLHNIFTSLAGNRSSYIAILVNIVTDTVGSGAERSETLGLHSQNRTPRDQRDYSLQSS